MADGIRVLDRAAAVMELLSEEGRALSLTEIARRLSLGKSTAHRLLASLSRLEFVYVNPETKTYGLGFGLLRLVADWLSKINVHSIALPHLRELRDRCGETVTLNLRVGNDRVAVEQLEASHEVRFVIQVGRPYPLVAGAAGKVILAYLDQHEISAMLAGIPLKRRRELEAELPRIRAAGHAVSFGERIPGSASVSTPVFDHEGNPVASVSVVGPEGRFSEQRVRAFVPACKRAASRISKQLRYAPGRTKSEQVC